MGLSSFLPISFSYDLNETQTFRTTTYPFLYFNSILQSTSVPTDTSAQSSKRCHFANLIAYFSPANCLGSSRHNAISSVFLWDLVWTSFGTSFGSPGIYLGHNRVYLRSIWVSGVSPVGLPLFSCGDLRDVFSVFPRFWCDRTSLHYCMLLL